MQIWTLYPINLQNPSEKIGSQKLLHLSAVFNLFFNVVWVWTFLTVASAKCGSRSRKGKKVVQQSRDGASRECVILVWCVSDFPKNPTCHRQSSSGNSCPGGGYVNKQHTLSHTHTHTNKPRGRNRKHTHTQVRLTVCPQHHLLPLTPPKPTENAHPATHTHTRTLRCMKMHLYI